MPTAIAETQIITQGALDQEKGGVQNLPDGTEPADGFQRLHFTALTPNPANPRRHIAENAKFLAIARSIKEHGVVEPLIAIPLPDGRAMLVCGHVRRRCTEYLVEQGELEPDHPHCYVPVILEPDMPAERQMALMFVENEHRIPISPIDEGLFYQSLLEQGWSKVRIAFQLEVSQPRINNRLDIVSLEPEIQEMFLDDRLPLLSAAPLLSIPKEKDRLRLAQMLAGRHVALERIRTLCDQVAEHGINALLQPSPNSKKAHTKPAGNETRRLTPERTVGLAALRAGALGACRSCEAVPPVSLPPAVLGSQVNAAAQGVCGDCSVRDIAAACRVCPLVSFMEKLANG